VFRFAADGECGCCHWPKNKCLCGSPIDQYGGAFALLDISGMRVPINPSGFPEIYNSGEPTRELLGRVAPCFFKVTISGVENNLPLSGWCNDCDNFNGEYFLSKTNQYYSVGVYDACSYIVPACNESKSEMCGAQYMQLLIRPSSIDLPQDRPIFLELSPTIGSVTYDLPPLERFRKEIGILYSGNYDSNLIGNNINESFNVSNLISLCGTSGSCNWDNVDIQIQSLERGHQIYTTGTDHCDLIQSYNQGFNEVFYGTHNYDHHNNQTVLIKFQNISSKDASIPFESAILTTCYDCEVLNDEYLEFRLDDIGGLDFLTDNIPMSSLLTVGQTIPSGGVPVVNKRWSCYLEDIKNERDNTLYLKKLCCRDSDDSMLYDEASSCINKVTLHTQRSINHRDITESGVTYINDWYYDHWGIINFIREDPDTAEELLVNQLYKNICYDCEQITSIGPSGGNTNYFFRTDNPTIDCTGTFNGVWNEEDIYTPLASAVRPCDFTGVDIEVLSSTQSVYSSGCEYNSCLCWNLEDINRDIQIDIPDAWTDLFNCCVGTVNRGGIVGSFVLSSDGLCDIDRTHTTNLPFCSETTSPDIAAQIAWELYYNTGLNKYQAKITLGFGGSYTVIFYKDVSQEKMCNTSLTTINCQDIIGDYYSSGNDTIYINFPVGCLEWDQSIPIEVSYV